MRIISQGGHADLPYEEIALCMACEDIIARHRDKEYLMARYSTIGKAQKAMEMLRENYGRLCNVKVLASGSSKHMEESFSENELKKIIDEYQEMNFFRFPNNEDVEVR